MAEDDIKGSIDDAEKVVPNDNGQRREAQRGYERDPVPGNLVDSDDKIPPPAGTIALAGGRIHEVIKETEAALIQAHSEIFQRGAILVRPAIVPKCCEIDGVKVASGSTQIVAVESSWLAIEATRVKPFVRFDMRSADWVRKDCPKSVAEGLLSQLGSWAFPVLRGVIMAPTLRADGSVLSKQGYDQATGLYLHAPGVELKIPDKPTKANAQQSMKAFVDLLSNFPFDTQADFAVAVAMILTALLRPKLPTAPLFAVDAPVMGSGKTLLVDVASLIATGVPAAVISQGATDEEFEKRTGAALIAGYPVVNIDNLNRPLGGDFLESLLTRPEIEVRILGLSKNTAVPTSLLFFATGNNLAVSGDMPRRTLVCRLDPRVERPSERRIEQDIIAEVSKRRSELIGHALTILRAYRLAGAKDVGLVPFGSYERWSDWVRSPLVWLDWPDPCETRTRFEEADPTVLSLAAVIDGWSGLEPGSRWTVRELIGQVEQSQHKEFKESLLDVAASLRDPGVINPKRLGHWLRRINGRTVHGKRIVQVGKYCDRLLYSLDG